MGKNKKTIGENNDKYSFELKKTKLVRIFSLKEEDYEEFLKKSWKEKFLQSYSRVSLNKEIKKGGKSKEKKIFSNLSNLFERIFSPLSGPLILLFGILLLNHIAKYSILTLISFRDGVTDSGPFFYGYLTGTILILFIGAFSTFSSLIDFVKRIIYKVKSSRKRSIIENQIKGKTISQLRAEIFSKTFKMKENENLDDYFVLNEIGKKGGIVHLEIHLKKTKLSWNPIKIFEHFHYSRLFNCIVIYVVSLFCISFLLTSCSYPFVLNSVKENDIHFMPLTLELGFLLGAGFSSLLMGSAFFLYFKKIAKLYRGIRSDYQGFIQDLYDDCIGKLIETSFNQEIFYECESIRRIKEDFQNLTFFPFEGFSVTRLTTLVIFTGFLSWIIELLV